MKNKLLRRIYGNSIYEATRRSSVTVTFDAIRPNPFMPKILIAIYDIIGMKVKPQNFFWSFVQEIVMRRQALSESNFDLWLLIGRANHAIMLVRQKELSQHHVPFRQTLFLYTLDSLGPKSYTI